MSISVRDLSFSYGTRRCAGSERGSGPYDVLRRVSFDLPDGALTCVLGPNGAGKSTLFRCMLCLEDGYTGAVEVNGRNLRSLPVRERAREVAFIPQSHDAVYDYSVLDMVLMGAAPEVGAFGAPGAAQVDRAWEALERVGIARLAHRPATQISGGEQQLVLIARALAQHARTIIMDEPTSALDYGNTMRVLGCVRQLAREGLCIVQSTHQPDQAFLFADAVLALALAGCGGTAPAGGAVGSASDAEPETVLLTDSAGREVEVPEHVDRVVPSGHTATQVLITIAPEKLAGLSQELTEDQLVYLDDRVADDLPVLGAAFGAKGDLNKEAVAATGAQLVIDTGEYKDGMKDDLDALQDQLGIPVVFVETKLDEWPQAYRTLGDLLGVEDRGEALASYCDHA